MPDTRNPDILVHNNGATISFEPVTTYAREQLKQKLQTAPWQWRNDTLIVDHHIAVGVQDFLQSLGLVLQ